MPERPSKRPIHPDKDLDRLVKKAWQAKWRCVRKGNYIYCYPPDGSRFISVKSTPSGSRYLKISKRNWSGTASNSRPVLV